MLTAAPVLTASQSRRATLPGVFLYWHLLSLDAPTVAVVWAWGFARAAGVQASVSTIAVLGLGTWLIYVGDRLLDARPGAKRMDLRERHFFHARHRGRLVAASFVLALPLLWLIVEEMPPAARLENTVIFAAAMVYFAFVHLPLVRIRFPRELIVALLFAAATVVPAWSAAGAQHGELLELGLLFAGLCWVNCAGIHIWEGQVRTAGIRIQAMALATAVGAEAIMLTVGDRHPAQVLLAGAGMASAALLFWLDRLALRWLTGQRAPSLLTLRVAADAALLTPLLLMLWRG